MGRWKELALEFGDFQGVLLLGDWKLCPLMKDLLGLWKWATLELCFDGPREGWAVVFCEEGVDALGILVLCVEEESVHIEKASADRWESVKLS